MSLYSVAKTHFLLSTQAKILVRVFLLLNLCLPTQGDVWRGFPRYWNCLKTNYGVMRLCVILKPRTGLTQAPIAVMLSCSHTESPRRTHSSCVACVCGPLCMGPFLPAQLRKVPPAPTAGSAHACGNHVSLSEASVRGGALFHLAQRFCGPAPCAGVWVWALLHTFPTLYIWFSELWVLKLKDVCYSSCWLLTFWLTV